MKQDPIEIKYTAEGTLTFSEIDPRIIYTGKIGHICMIDVPTEAAAEIIAKLKVHPAVTSVNNVLTPYGRSINYDLRPPLTASNPHATLGTTAAQQNAQTGYNPDAPQPTQMQGEARPEPSIISPQEREKYTVQICIAAQRAFNLHTVDTRITPDTPWGKKDWDQGAPIAISCLIPAIHQREIIEKLMKNPLVIFAKGSWEVMSTPRTSINPDVTRILGNHQALFPATNAVEIRYTLNNTGMADHIDPRITYIREEAGRVAVISAPKNLADEIIAKLKAHPAVTSVNGEVMPSERVLQRPKNN